MKSGPLAKPSALILLVISTVFRLIPHPANLTPLGATALFGGAKLTRPWNYLLPLLILFVSDLFLGLHNTMPFVYGSFLITVWLGERFLQQNLKLFKIGGLGVASALIFFVISNFGVWLEGYLYPRTVDGLIQSYAAALPFLRNMLIGDVIFSVGFFALYEAAERRQLVMVFDKKIKSLLIRI